MFRGSWCDLLAGMFYISHVALSVLLMLRNLGSGNANVGLKAYILADRKLTDLSSGRTYHALKVDVWSLGATVWETAQSEPPFTDIQDPRQFGDRWPSLTHPEIYSRSFHDFLRLCSEPAATRPDPSDLLNVCSTLAFFHAALTKLSLFRPHSFAMHVDALSMSSYFHSVERSKKQCLSAKMMIHRNYIFASYTPSFSYSFISTHLYFRQHSPLLVSSDAPLSLQYRSHLPHIQR